MNVEKLREELFATLAALRDKEKPMDIERAKAVVQVADAITATAKVEVDAMKITGSTGTGFITPNQPRLSGPSPAATLRPAIATVPPNGHSMSKGK